MCLPRRNFGNSLSWCDHLVASGNTLELVVGIASLLAPRRQQGQHRLVNEHPALSLGIVLVVAAAGVGLVTVLGPLPARASPITRSMIDGLCHPPLLAKPSFFFTHARKRERTQCDTCVHPPTTPPHTRCVGYAGHLVSLRASSRWPVVRKRRRCVRSVFDIDRRE